MNRYSLPHQVSVLFAIFIGITSAFIWILMARSGSGLFAPLVFDAPTIAVCVVLPLVAIGTSQLVPRAFTRWMIDRHPLLGSMILSFIHVYILVATTQLIFWISAENLESWSDISRVTAALASCQWGWIIVYPLGALAYLACISSPYLLALSLIGAGTFGYLGNRRDYL